MQLLFKTLVMALMVLLAGAAMALWSYRDLPAERLEARYAGPSSKFINIDGARLHFRDEGSGPPVVLIHGELASLMDWEPWAEALRGRYRIIRLDLPAHGLSGADPSGDYSNHRWLVLLDRFFAALALRRVTLAGSDQGARLALHYAAAFPERVDRLVMLNPGPVDHAARIRLLPGAPLFRHILPEAAVARVLKQGFGDPARVAEALVRRWYQLWRREGQREAMLARRLQQEADDLTSVLPDIRIPTLLLWGEADTGSSGTSARDYLALMEAAPLPRSIGYPGVGHFALQEAGADIVIEVGLWLDGKLDTAPVDDITMTGI